MLESPALLQPLQLLQPLSVFRGGCVTPEDCNQLWTRSPSVTDSNSWSPCLWVQRIHKHDSFSYQFSKYCTHRDSLLPMRIKREKQ